MGRPANAAAAVLIAAAAGWYVGSGRDLPDPRPVLAGFEMPDVPSLLPGGERAEASGERGGEGRSRGRCDPDPVAGLDDAQMGHAVTIARVAQERDLPDRAVVVALATALQESGLYNLPYGDRDSLGLFQQRPSMGWGAPDQVRDPEYAAGKFFDKLVQVDGWEDMRITEAAQAVQISAFPEAYDQHVSRAEEIADAALACVD